MSLAQNTKQLPNSLCRMLFYNVFLNVEGPWIHQSSTATISSGQFRVRVVHTSHYSITVHREPEHQLHITSSFSSSPHDQPQHAVVKFQWMVRVNIFENKNKKQKRNRKKTAGIEQKKLLGIKDFTQSASAKWTEKNTGGLNDQWQAVLCQWERMHGQTGGKDSHRV